MDSIEMGRELMVSKRLLLYRTDGCKSRIEISWWIQRSLFGGRQAAFFSFISFEEMKKEQTLDPCFVRKRNKTWRKKSESKKWIHKDLLEESLNGSSSTGQKEEEQHSSFSMHCCERDTRWVVWPIGGSFTLPVQSTAAPSEIRWLTGE